MAGGKETPRQKMVGMMYLVLTALLALNVSITVIDKFVFLNDSLVSANNEMEERNAVILKSIKKAVEDAGSRPDDKKVSTTAEEIRAETGNVMTKLNDLKATMVTITEGYLDGYQAEYPGDAKNLVGKTDYDKVGNYMLPVEEGGEGKGAELKAWLDGYVDFLQTKLKEVGLPQEEIESFRHFALDADEDPVYRNDPNQKGKAFAALAFEGSPTPAGLATMSEFQSRVLNYEARALGLLSGKVGADDLKFDRIVPMVNPESKYVAAGTKYSAKMFIAASSSGVVPKMSYDGNEIPVDGSGQGSVEFTATAGAFDKDGMARKTYLAAIEVKMPGGRDTVFQQEIEYFVVKPTLQIQSQSVNALYLNCGNKLDIQVPQLGPTYNPSFSATGGSAIKGAEKGQVTIVPTSEKEVNLTVSSNGIVVGTRGFAVRRIPAPSIGVYTDQGEVDMGKGISAKTPRIYLRANPDESFQQFLPDDAKFRIAEAQVTLVSGGLARKTITVGSDVDLSAITSMARKGDQISIEIKRVQRQNFKGDVENFPNFQRYHNISLN